MRALAREDQGYMSYAIRLMANRNEDADVRYAAMKGAMAQMNYHQEPAEKQIQFARACVDDMA